jgi:hypothetical protein
MKTTRRFRRGLPSPLEVSFYLFVVIAFCVINWTLLKADDTVKSETRPFETMLVEAMLEEMVPVMKYETQSPVSPAPFFITSSGHRLELEPWMISYEAFTLAGTESELALEDWMISTSTWSEN